MTQPVMPAHTFSPSDLSLARDALLIVHGLVAGAVGDTRGEEAVSRLNDLASKIRADEGASDDAPSIVCDWPWSVPAAGTGEMSFHVAAGGTEYDGVTAQWTTDAEGRLVFTYSYDGRDELFESEAVADTF